MPSFRITKQLLDKIKILELENEKLKFELDETKKHLKKYTLNFFSKRFLLKENASES